MSEAKIHQRRAFQHADEVFNIAAQVSHDITSPVQALNGLLEGTEQTKVPVEIRVKLRTEIRRIHDIAQDLLSRSRRRNSEQGDQVQVSEERAPELLTPLIDGIASEKRMAHEKNQELQVSFHHAAEDFGIFASVNAAKFERLISNLLNNAIEALRNGAGKVEIKMAKQRDLIVLTIADSGSGIPPEILSQLGRRGATFGRKNGNGLGLFDAKTTFESWGGDFQIQSEVGKGTRIQILLRQARPPRWFADTLYLAPGQRIVILDDDDRIHEIWKRRFSQLSSGDGFEVLSFRTGDDFKAWFQNAKRSETPNLYLFDHDLSEGSESGLDIAESLGISSSTILVTGRPDVQSLRPRCEQSGCRLLPKTLLETVPIHAVTPQSVKPDAIFIDDESVHLSRWERSAKKNGKDLRTFSDTDCFLGLAWIFNREVPIFIDMDLGNGIPGQVVSKKISELGFAEIHLATAYPKHLVNLAEMPWVRSVVGKEPPWALENSKKVFAEIT